MDTTSVIDSTVKTERSRDLVRRIIPVLVHWATTEQRDKTYTDLLHALGYEKFSGIGHQLGSVDEVFKALENITHETIPTLNTLCKGKNGLPSDGFAAVYPIYESMKETERKVFVAGLDEKAISYKKWGKVLDDLGLKPLRVLSEDEIAIIKTGTATYGSGGEGEKHKALKMHILTNPASVGIKNVSYMESEHVLPSGDKLDVYFETNENSHIAIEVKSSISAEQDITRGIFQCVKYKAVLEALRRIESEQYSIKTLLVTEGKMSDLNRHLAKELGVSFIDNYKK